MNKYEKEAHPRKTKRISNRSDQKHRTRRGKARPDKPLRNQKARKDLRRRSRDSWRSKLGKGGSSDSYDESPESTFEQMGVRRSNRRSSGKSRMGAIRNHAL